jgi:hypothetical protein
MAVIDEDTTEEDNDDNNSGDDIVQESIHDSVTKQSSEAMIVSETAGSDILKLTDLLPNPSQGYGHLMRMNALPQIIIHHPSSIFYTIKAKKGNETSVRSTFTSLSQTNKHLIKDMIKEIGPDHGSAAALWHAS